VCSPLTPVNRNSLPATTILLLPIFAKITDSSKSSVTLISSPTVNAPLLSAISLLIRQALFFRGSGQVRLTFSGNAQNFREVEILGKNSTLLIDSGAPEPLKNNAWRINREIYFIATPNDKIGIKRCF
jgi:hypothetical protein